MLKTKCPYSLDFVNLKALKWNQRNKHCHSDSIVIHFCTEYSETASCSNCVDEAILKYSIYYTVKQGKLHAHAFKR